MICSGRGASTVPTWSQCSPLLSSSWAHVGLWSMASSALRISSSNVLIPVGRSFMVRSFELVDVSLNISTCQRYSLALSLPAYLSS
jgi:hypothetical protein